MHITSSKSHVGKFLEHSESLIYAVSQRALLIMDAPNIGCDYKTGWEKHQIKDDTKKWCPRDEIILWEVRLFLKYA